jgi:hypothetical protein
MSVLDPMGFARRLDCVADYFPLGFPVRVCSNSSLILGAAAASWDGFPAAFTTSPLEIHALVEEVDSASPPVPPAYRGHQHLLMIMGANDSAVCDHARGVAFCRMSESTARQTAFTAYYYLEAIAFHLLTQLYVTPVHAACLTRKGAGVLLCGDTGAGKTSLAYACAKRGWSYVSDNESWLLRDHEELIALGNPHRIRFRESAVELFPELHGRQPFLFANGKMSLSLEMSGRPEFATAYRAKISHLVFLDRQRSPGVRAVAKQEALGKLLNGVPAYSPEVRRHHETSLRRLVAAETLCISYESLETGCDLLDKLVGES